MRTSAKWVKAAVLAGVLLVGGFSLLPGKPGSPAVQAAPAERHPHIRRAIAELREARRELKEAAHDFGGHRVDALAAVDTAIKQLEIALKFDRR